MSSTINRKQSFWKMVEASLRSILADGRVTSVTTLTADDAASWSRTLVLNCLILQDLLPDGSRRRDDAAMKQWCLTMASHDILDVARAMKEFQLFIRCYPDEWSFLDWSDFKRRYPYRFTGNFFSPVRDYLDAFLSDPHPAAFRVLNQWISFPLKLTLVGLSSSLTQKAEEEYLQNEDRLEKLELSVPDCDNLANVIQGWFRGFGYAQDFSPHHSNGAVANRETKLGLLGKYRGMVSDVRISTLYRKFGLAETEFGFSNFELSSAYQPQAKLITVPKGIDKRRSICPEPAEYQFNQQGIWDLLDAYIFKHPVLSRHIAIHDQSMNREAALAASSSCDAATIDLSSASDSVSWRLIKRVFRKSPKLLWMLWATRSTTVQLPSRRVITTNKYAPMGSSLCFPIESILFAAICQVAVDHTQLGHRLANYHVYGDDIIVPDFAYHETLRLLSSCGFIVNEQKTFDPFCRYKESCGIEGLDGVDVSCQGVSRKFSALPLAPNRPKLVACYLTLANELYKNGFVAARTYVLGCLAELPTKYHPPFSGVWGVGIFSPEPTNWRANVRWNEGYQCEEILVGCFSSQQDRDSFSTSDEVFVRIYGEDYQSTRYFETLRRLAATKRSGLFIPEDLIRVSLSKSQLRLVARWVPRWWFSSPLTLSPVMVGNEQLTFSIIDGRDFAAVDGE